ncbi:chloride/fluoride channel protein EriC [Clostridium aceticum]|uniref:Chloride/fluoride channel protein EriC n=1 Tax=Clostridium aceticum TaxID=84022 RepID=A0A0D8I730_9CLOT|nr:chloride channel protein [Clostridium aceticum]AKL93833.1 chloride/fluoride channel protein EriC [Clostridium aceticum]KJF25859.1 chloride channel core protein [Clostridium aceticum]
MLKIFQYVGEYMTKWLIVATLMGIGGGLAAVALRFSIDFVTGVSYMLPMWIAPVIGGLLVSLLYKWDKNAAGFGTDKYIYAVNKKNSPLPFRMLFSKLIATAITLGFQGSGGVEGPMLVIGGSIASGITRLKGWKNYFCDEDCRILAICGAAGAIGAIFRSPLGGGIFVVEILYKSSLHYADLFPAMLSSTMGFVIYSMIAKATPMFVIPNYLPNVWNVPSFIVAGITAGLASLLFMGIFRQTSNFFQKLPFKSIHPAIGGLVTGIILIFLPDVAATGTNVIQDMIDGVFPITLLLLLLIGKIVATSFTVTSGGSAGLVIPALFIGAVSGNFISAAIGDGGVGLSASLVITGMAASLASVANVPIAAAIMLVEMVGLKLGVPATLGSIIGYALGHSQVIYGVTSPDHWQFEEVKQWRKNDINKKDH